jgi:acyl-CoA synthetase (AMP-forming)/AMP-acid ligase II/acyl carrier protein
MPMAHSTWNTPEFQRRFTSHDTLFKLARHQACASPEAVGFTFLVDGETEEQNLTYGELDARARAVAAKIQSVSRPGNHVLLLYGPGLDYIVAFFACQYAGVIPVPAYPPDPMRSQRTLARLQAIVTDCGASLALGTADNVGWLGALASQTACLPVATDTAEDWSGLPWTEPQSNRDQVALLQYTSGSTAAPRGVMVTHRNLWSQFETVQVGDGADAVGVSWLPFYHDLGLIGGILIPLAFRRRTILMSPLAFVQHPLRWLLAIARYRGTTTGAPNFAFDLCVNKFVPTQAEGLDLSSLRILLTGAEPVRSESLDRFMATFAPYGLRSDVWRPGYGMAETTLGATGIRHGGQLRQADFSIKALENNRALPVVDGAVPSRRMVGCGWALEGSEVIVVDPARSVELPEGQVGEVWVHGPIVARGYWNRPEETEAVFGACLAPHGRGPFLRTGDLGFQHEGQLYLTGRSKEVMVFWGRNVYPQDVETTTWSTSAALKQNTGAAFALEADGYEQLVVVQEIARPRTLDLDALANAICLAIRAEHQVPFHALVFIKAGTLPKTSSGKIQRLAARDLYLNKQLEVIKQWQFPSVLSAAVAPVIERALPGPTEIRRWLVARIARHCATDDDQIDIGAALTRYVMDSVSAMSIAMELQLWLGRSVTPTVVFDSPSVALLAERLADPHSYLGETAQPLLAVDHLNPSELDQALVQVLGGADTPANVPPGTTNAKHPG